MSVIDDKYNQLGGSRSFLGPPVHEERSCPDGVGHYREFKDGSIHYHPSTGAHETHGAIRKKWAQMQFETGELGYPISDERNVVEAELAELLALGRDTALAAQSTNRCSEFQRGRIFCWSPDTHRYFTTVITTDGARTDEDHNHPSEATKRAGTDDQYKKCHVVIHTAATAAAGIGAGLAQLPGSDNAALVAVQISMAVALGNIFKIQVSDTAARGLIMTALASMTGPIIARSITQIVVGWIPGAGNAINAATAAGITEAIGWILVKEFEKQSPEEQ